MVLFLCWTVGCNSSDTTQSKTTPTSEVVFAPLCDSVRIPDPLNVLYFKVSVLKTERRGTFEVVAWYGYQEGRGQMVLPKGGENFVPVLTKVKGEMRFQIGFKTDPEAVKVFPYYEVDAGGLGMKMNYTHAYSFQ